MRELLGGKGANLAEMTKIGLPVPQGFTISTEACTKYYEDGRQINPEIEAEIFENIDNPVIDIATLEKIVELILAYHIRRLACGVPSNTLRGLYIYLYSRVFKVASNKKKYYEAINKFLWTVTSKDAIPSGAEFETALLSANIYRINALCKYLLSEIENGDGKETLNIDDYKESMKDIYTTSVNEETIDEAPMVYKPMQEIIDCIGDTIEIVKIIKPIYNFKASE